MVSYLENLPSSNSREMEFKPRCTLCGSTDDDYHPYFRCPLICVICNCSDRVNYHQTKNHRYIHCDMIGVQSHRSESCPDKLNQDEPKSYPPAVDSILSKNG